MASHQQHAGPTSAQFGLRAAALFLGMLGLLAAVGFLGVRFGLVEVQSVEHEEAESLAAPGEPLYSGMYVLTPSGMNWVYYDAPSDSSNAALLAHYLETAGLLGAGAQQVRLVSHGDTAYTVMLPIPSGHEQSRGTLFIVDALKIDLERFYDRPVHFEGVSLAPDSSLVVVPIRLGARRD